MSERPQVKHHSAVNIVDRLVERKLITREPGETDRRRRHVALAANGEKLIEELAAAHRKEIRGRSVEMSKVLKRLAMTGSNLLNSSEKHDDINDEERAAKNNKSFVVTLRARQRTDE